MTAFSGHSKQPVFFREFFELGQPDSASPFLTPEARYWGLYLPLKAALFAAALLAGAFALSFNETTLPISNLMLIAVYFFAGIPSLIESIEDLLHFQINIDILMTLAAFGSVLIGSPMEGGLLLVLFSLSGAMEDAVNDKAKSTISSLHQLSPTRACAVEGDKLIERSIHEIKVGALILVKAGEMVPLDGVVVKGASSLNLVHLTGESIPVTKRVGDTVPAGARNLDGAITVEVSHTNEDSTLAKIIQLVTQAQEARPRLQRWFDKVSETYAMIIIAFSALVALSLPYILNIPFIGHEGSIYRALSFLIAASPCALIIAIPIAYLSSVSACARKGVLLKGVIALDALAKCEQIAFDKTGTLTTGELTCLGMVPYDPEMLAVAAALERNAVHPIAKAILEYAKELKPAEIENFKQVPGYGLEAHYKHQRVAIGSADFTHFKGDLKDEIISILQVGDRHYIFRFQDKLRADAKNTIYRLQHECNLNSVMLTGDHYHSAKRTAEELGMNEFFADLKPENKLSHVTALSEKHALAMVGDGINDAPALARATVGISMGKEGSTAAIDAADIILLHDKLEHLVWLFKKATSTQSIVKQNLILATVAIFMASIPALLGWVPLWLAVIMHEGGTVLVGLNGLRLLRE